MLEGSFDVELFADGSSVLERVISDSDLPDVLVLDWYMDGIGGEDVLQFLRAHDGTVGLPILGVAEPGSRHADPAREALEGEVGVGLERGTK